MGDHHVHLHPHGAYDGIGPEPGVYPPGHIEAFVAAGMANGADQVGFTEHLYRCVEATPVLGEWWADDPRADLVELTLEHLAIECNLSLERYVDAVVAAKDRGLPVLLGLEVDFFPNTIDAVLEFLSPYPFDFLVGSIHWVGAWGIDLPDQIHEFERRGHRQAYEDYFAAETALARSGSVDVLAHADVVKKRGIALPEPPIELYERLAAAAASSGTAVEVSTAGLRQPINEMYPHPALLQSFHAHGVPITVASDGHRPHECGSARNLAVELAESVGYTTRVTFDQRRRIVRPL
jgi:histidinol-phosphatase (PHP family)